ncbi:MAG TPA: type I-U CRISPR-associated helicase/endonuclease Cas3, partial [Acidobacteriota bacterium]|nr:type I-U CRISPR-associated helicase/endonuclease Cas3 [Acidobacteriota bacterium]
MAESLTFDKTFEKLTGHYPFPWQERLYHDWFARGAVPRSCDLPTGLGKTSVIAVWLIALANGARIPRRLVYVVNRRTVVDQTTAEVERIRDRIETAGISAALRRVFCLDDAEPPLAISTLRGQFADNHEWSADPSRPAVICGTVDMIGSRLLFGGYGIGFKSRPLHAGFLGQDSLLIHDEAHLEPAFQKLLAAIEKEQRRERENSGELPWPTLQVMQLTATTRNAADDEEDQFGLTPEERNLPDKLPGPPTEPIHHVWCRLRAKKILNFHRADGGKDDVTNQIVRLAKTHANSNVSVLIFVRKVDDVEKICDQLTSKKGGVPTDHIQKLTGTIRGLERDALVKSDPVFMRFLPDKSRNPLVRVVEGTVYLVCTSAGEVGVDISADHMVCDLTTFESMVQRFGRVNRFGSRQDTRIDVVYPVEFERNEKLISERQATLRLLEQLNGDASPLALARLNAEQRQAAFAPEPTILPVT